MQKLFVDLLPDEASMFEVSPTVESPHSGDDESINDRYTSGEVRIVTEQARYPLTAIPGMVNSRDYELNPEFQRRHRWNNVRKSRLIESFIMNVPIPPIFLYEARYSFYEVMDGLQRLSAIRDFYADEFALEGLQEWSELNGKKYSQLPVEVRRGVDRRYLSSIILLHETAKSDEEAQRLKQLVFERINSGGERLTPQESRNAIFPGPMNTLCIELSRDTSLRALWHIPEVDSGAEEDSGKGEVEHQLGKSLFKSMGDVELVLRFFAYRQQLTSQESLTLRDYLDAYLRRANALPAAELETLAGIFRGSAKVVLEVFGEYALYMYKEYKGKWRYTGRPTLTVYDPLMWAVSANLERSSQLIERAHIARELLKEMYKLHPQSFSGRTAERPDIENRNKLFLNLIEEVLQKSPDAKGVDSSSSKLDEVEATAPEEEVLERIIAEDVERSEHQGGGTLP